jgi:hypothetical protein
VCGTRCTRTRADLDRPGRTRGVHSRPFKPVISKAMVIRPPASYGPKAIVCMFPRDHPSWEPSVLAIRTPLRAHYTPRAVGLRASRPYALANLGTPNPGVPVIARTPCVLTFSGVALPKHARGAEQEADERHA